MINHDTHINVCKVTVERQLLTIGIIGGLIYLCKLSTLYKKVAARTCLYHAASLLDSSFRGRHGSKVDVVVVGDKERAEGG